MATLLPAKSRINRAAWAIEAQERRRARINLTKGLVGYWKLDETSGTRMDATGRGNDLTATNSPGSASGKIGNAASFVATNFQFLSRADNADLKFDGNFTIACWAYLASKSSEMAAVSKYILGGDFEDNFILTYDVTNDRMRGYLSNGTGPEFVLVYANHFGSVPTAEWLFVACWRNGTEFNIQVNNGPSNVVDASAVGEAMIGAANFIIGGVQSGTAIYWDGRVDEVGKWNRALNSAELTALYNSGAGLPYESFLTR